MKLQGKLIKKEAVKEFGEKGFRKREIVILTDEQYPQSIMIELHQDNVDLVKEFGKDDMIEVSINVRGREWINPEGVSRFFNSLVGWRIEKMAATSPAPVSPESIGTTVEDDDDLPF